MTIDDVLTLQTLSIRQPWASMIISGMKTIELRSWQTSYRGWLWIHSGKKVDAEALHLLDEQAQDYQTGGILGIAQLGDVRRIESVAEWRALRGGHRSPGAFHEGAYGWHFTDAIALRRKVAAMGELFLFPLDASTRATTRTAIESDRDFLDAIAGL
jgi:hypothetical protein